MEYTFSSAISPFASNSILGTGEPSGRVAVQPHFEMSGPPHRLVCFELRVAIGGGIAAAITEDVHVR
eukprot:12925520-Alexandrium_andersonii.AAC.1